MPKGAKKRAKLKKKQEGSHPAGSNGGTNNNNNNNGGNNSSRRDAASDGNHLPIQLNIPPLDMSEDSMESSEEMVTPRAEADEEEKKATTSEVLVERAVEVVEDGTGEVGEEVMVDALPPEASEREQDGKVDARAKAHVVVQEPEVQDVVVSEAPEMLEPEVKSDDVVVQETAKVHPVHEPERKGEEAKGDGVVPRSCEASGAHATEVGRGPAVAVAASGHRATWWNCCGVFDAFAGSER